VVDLGPEGGSGGGQIIAEGTPETIIKQKQSHTGKFLKPLLNLPTGKKTANKKPAVKKTATKKPAAKKAKVKVKK